MKNETIAVVMSVLKMDESVTETKISEIAALLKGADLKHSAPTDSLLNVTQVGKMLGVSKRQVWRYAKMGKLNPLNLSKRVTRFRSSEVIRLMTTDHSIIGQVA